MIFFLGLHKRLIIFALLYLVFQFIPLAILVIMPSTLSPQLHLLLVLMLGLSIIPLFVYQMILSRGPGGVMYYAHAVNMVGILLALSRGSFTYIFSKTLTLTQLLFIHPGPLMTLFIIVEYLLFKHFLRKRIGYRYMFLFWTLGPILYIATLIPATISIVKAFITPPYTTYYRSPLSPQLGYAALFVLYAIPGPFISLATLPKYLQLAKLTTSTM